MAVHSMALHRRKKEEAERDAQKISQTKAEDRPKAKEGQGPKRPAPADLESQHQDEEDGEQPAQDVTPDAREQRRVRRDLARQLLEQPRNKPKPKRRKTTRECAVCTTEFSIEQFPNLPRCSHEPDVCVECFDKLISAQLETNTWEAIGCPHSECEVVLQHHDIQTHATKGTFDRYDNAAMLSALSSDPNFRWCRQGGCKSGQTHESGEEGNIFRCAACGHRVCVIHDIDWHEGESCGQYNDRIAEEAKRKKRLQEQQLEEKASLEQIANFTKKCPGEGCGWNIEKNGGCEHMTCKKCRHEFCWLCLASYNNIRRDGNHVHREDCPHYRAIQPAQPAQ